MEDDVQIIGYTAPPSVVCDICHNSLDSLTEQERIQHYEVHFNQPSSSSNRSPPKSSSTSKTYPVPARPKTSLFPSSSQSQNVFWYSEQSDPPPRNFTPGLVPLLHYLLLQRESKGLIKRAVLCRKGVCHVGTELFDIGWGCGYRNFLMACTSLFTQQTQPMYFPLLDLPAQSGNSTGDHLGPPGVRNLQLWIEHAWKNGYDCEGARQLKQKLSGTNKWIGTGELYVAFVSRGIPYGLSFLRTLAMHPEPVAFNSVRLVDFPKSAASTAGPATALANWMKNYFDGKLAFGATEVSEEPENATKLLMGASPVIISDRLPVILQHKGHSRTVIGYEMSRSKSIDLLVFDPSRKIPASTREAALALHKFDHRSTHNGYTARHSRLSSPRKWFESLKNLSPQRRAHANESGAKKRSASSGEQGRMPKRIKDENATVIDVDEVFVETNAGNESDATPTIHCDPEALKIFRVSISKLSKNDQYQILYFPLTDPLDDDEKRKRRIVTSERIET